MNFTREELDWIEAEWAFHLHGRSAFLSREDFLCLQDWDAQGIPATLIVSAMETYFARRTSGCRPKAFIALSHLEKELKKAFSYKQSLQRSGSQTPEFPEWQNVSEPLKSDPKAKQAFESWKQLNQALPAPDSPAYLERFDGERQAFQSFISLAVGHLGPKASEIEGSLKCKLEEAGIHEGSLVWKRAWEHHWSRLVCEAWGIQP